MKRIALVLALGLAMAAPLDAEITESDLKVAIKGLGQEPDAFGTVGTVALDKASALSGTAWSALKGMSGCARREGFDRIYVALLEQHPEHEAFWTCFALNRADERNEVWRREAFSQEQLVAAMGVSASAAAILKDPDPRVEGLRRRALCGRPCAPSAKLLSAALSSDSPVLAQEASATAAVLDPAFLRLRHQIFAGDPMDYAMEDPYRNLSIARIKAKDQRRLLSMAALHGYPESVSAYARACLEKAEALAAEILRREPKANLYPEDNPTAGRFCEGIGAQTWSDADKKAIMALVLPLAEGLAPFIPANEVCAYPNWLLWELPVPGEKAPWVHAFIGGHQDGSDRFVNILLRRQPSGWAKVGVIEGPTRLHAIKQSGQIYLAGARSGGKQAWFWRQEGPDWVKVGEVDAQARDIFKEPHLELHLESDGAVVWLHRRESFAGGLMVFSRARWMPEEGSGAVPAPDFQPVSDPERAAYELKHTGSTMGSFYISPYLFMRRQWFDERWYGPPPKEMLDGTVDVLAAKAEIEARRKSKAFR